jgi:hypothetical protein
MQRLVVLVCRVDLSGQVSKKVLPSSRLLGIKLSSMHSRLEVLVGGVATIVFQCRTSIELELQPIVLTYLSRLLLLASAHSL